MCSALSGLLEFSPVLLRYFISGGNFTLAELGVCEPTPPPHPNAVPYCPDLALLQRGYSLSAGSDADSDPEGPLSPERAIQLWAGQGRVKSRRSSGVSSRENSALTLTDSENDNKSDDESEILKGQQNAIERSFASNSRPYEISFLILCYIGIIVCLQYVTEG
ncbi:Teneurin-2 [Dissostichus eleginoides]|uniref:Teneurin-2 n=1 Tax=Dissostichus eleginoides TaxID=100907 RepID=A0AAD9CMV0_DISEL|nr:Teneurin-2 [Dissostichus eleginoides]